MAKGERVRTYLTLLSTFTLKKMQGEDLASIEVRMKTAWRNLDKDERAQVQRLLKVPGKPAKKRTKLRLIRGGSK